MGHTTRGERWVSEQNQNYPPQSVEILPSMKPVAGAKKVEAAALQYYNFKLHRDKLEQIK